MDNNQKEKKDLRSSGKGNKRHQGAPDMSKKEYGKHSRDESGGAKENRTKKQGNSI